METLLADMESEMRSTFREELEIFYRMSGVFIQMLMYDAEKQSVTVKGDVGFMENYKALQDMKEFEELVVSNEFTLTKRATMKAQLPTLNAVHVEKVVVYDEQAKA